MERVFSVKHEPRHLDEITGHEDVVGRLKQAVATGKLGHMLLAGPPGAGKLAIAKCLARDLFADELGSSVNIVHAADPLTKEERDQANRDSYVSTSRIGSMAGQTFTWPKFIQVRVKPVVELKAMNSRGFKLIIVTDFDLLSHEQQGFRRMMEQYGKNCRFLLITTQISTIIDPIISRCQVFLVNPVTKARFYKEISRVGSVEGFKVNYTFINALYYVSKGNIGKALNIMQLFVMKNQPVNEDNLFLLMKDMDKGEDIAFLQAGLDGNFFKAREAYHAVKKRDAVSLPTFLDMLRRQTLQLPLTQEMKARVIDAIADVDAGSITSASDEPHVASLVFKLGSIARMHGG